MNSREKIDELTQVSKEIRGQQQKTRTDLENWNPHLLEDLIRDIQAQLTAYEAAHPANQGYYVTLAIAEIERFIKNIGAAHAVDIIERRKKYDELVGLLYWVHERNAKVYNQHFDSIMLPLLSKHPISIVDAKKAYADLCLSQPEVFPVLTKDLLAACLHEKYMAAKRELCQAINIANDRNTPEWCVFARSGLSVLAEIECKKKLHAENNNDLFDIKFYTALLNKTANVMRQPQDESLRQEYLALAKYNQAGKASISRKLAGAMLTLIGASIVVATVVAEVASLGISAPVSFAAKIGGGVACLMGLGLFASGVQNGIAQAANKFSTAAKNVNSSRPIANERTPLFLAP